MSAISNGAKSILGRSKLSKMLPSFSPRNLRIFENYPRKIFKDDFALILVFEPRHCSNPRNFSKLSFLRGIAIGGHLTMILSPYLFSGMWKQGGPWVPNSFWPPLGALHQNFQQNSVPTKLVHPQYLILSYDPVSIIFWKENFRELHENPRK